MGRVEKLRRERRRKLLTRLAKEDHEKFQTEWDKRKESWLKAIHSFVKDKAVFTEKEYELFLEKYPHADNILGSAVRARKGDVYIFVNRISFCQQDVLGEAYNVIMSHIKFGTLKGRRVFDIIDEAKKILKECGEEAVKLALNDTEDLLMNEGCSVLSKSICNYDRKYVKKSDKK